MANPGPESEKARRRRETRQLLRKLSPGELSARSAEIVEGLAEWMAGMAALQRVAIYAGLTDEPSLGALHHYRAEREFVYPRVGDERRLSFHMVTAPDGLARGYLGIPEPDPLLHGAVPVTSIDAFLCPGVAFAMDGTRLGRGGGYYDRALAEARPDALRIGVCFRYQVSETLPREPHDMLMTHVADETGVLAVRPIPGARA